MMDVMHNSELVMAVDTILVEVAMMQCVNLKFSVEKYNLIQC